MNHRKNKSSTVQLRPYNNHRCTDIPDVFKLGLVVVPVDETEEDLEHQQSNLWILGEIEGKQRLQEGARQRSQHVGGLETCRHLRQSEAQLKFTN